MDARIKQSQKAIKMAFYELLHKYPIDKISVTDICKIADVNRATFYKYYENPRDLLGKLEDESLAVLSEKIRTFEANGVDAVYQIVLNDVKEHYPFYRLVFVDNIDGYFRNKLLDTCHDYEIAEIKNSFPMITDKQCEWLYHFLAEGCIGIFKEWVNSGMTSSIEEMVHFAIDFISKINRIGKMSE